MVVQSVDNARVVWLGYDNDDWYKLVAKPGSAAATAAFMATKGTDTRLTNTFSDLQIATPTKGSIMTNHPDLFAMATGLVDVYNIISRPGAVWC
jgi:hypothetical protein